MYCTRCGRTSPPGSTSCTSCGASLASASSLGQGQAGYGNQGYGGQAQQPSYGQQSPVYQQNYSAGGYGASAPVMGVKDYVIMMIISAIPIVGLIMLFVWAFGNESNPNKKNYAKALLLLMAIAFAVYLVFFIFIGMMFASMF